MQVYAIATREGRMKHVGVSHHNAYGPSPLCGRRTARPAYRADGVRDESVLVAEDPSEIHLPWCSNCEATLENMVRAVAS